MSGALDHELAGGLARRVDFARGSATVIGADELSECEAWPRAFAQCAKDHRYYELVERTLDNPFVYRYLVLRDGAGMVRAIQPFLLVQQNLVEGIPGAIRRGVEAVRQKLPGFLTMRVLMVGCAAGEGHLSPEAEEERRWTAEALWQCLPIIAHQQGASLVVLKDFSARYRDVLSSFSRHGFTRVPSMPMTRLDLNFADFEDYLAHLSYGTRKSLRRKFRKTERSARVQLEVTSSITDEVEEAYPLYLAVQDRSPMKFEKLSKEYLVQLGELMPERVRYFLWRLDGRIVAFSVCLVHGNTLYDEYLGLDYNVALDLHLYFYTFRDILSWAMAEGLKWYFSSPLNYDPKLHLGCELAPLDLYVRHNSSLLRPIFGRVVKWLEPTRHDPVLRQFPNAAELTN